MAGDGTSRSLEETPTWAVATVCSILVAISIFIEHIIHKLGKWLTKKNKRALKEALEKIKSELMLLGLLSFLLTVGQGSISKICISKSVADTWHPCNNVQENKLNKETDSGRSISDSHGSFPHVLTRRGYGQCAAKA